MTEDMNKGMIDLFWSLPMARSAVLSGRTASDLVYNTGIIIVLMLTGLATGWRVHNGLADFMLGWLLMLAFAYAMSWMGVFFATIVPTVEVAQQVGFMWIFPLTFLSSAFVPIVTMPSWLQAVRRVEPGQHPDLVPARPLRQPEPHRTTRSRVSTRSWCRWVRIAIVLAVFALLAIKRYRNITR